MEIDPGSSSGASASEPLVLREPGALGDLAVREQQRSGGVADCGEAQHHRARERPRLAPEVSNAVHVDTDFFLDLADNTRFE